MDSTSSFSNAPISATSSSKNPSAHASDVNTDRIPPFDLPNQQGAIASPLQKFTSIHGDNSNFSIETSGHPRHDASQQQSDNTSSTSTSTRPGDAYSNAHTQPDLNTRSADPSFYQLKQQQNGYLSAADRVKQQYFPNYQNTSGYQPQPQGYSAPSPTHTYGHSSTYNGSQGRQATAPMALPASLPPNYQSQYSNISNCNTSQGYQSQGQHHPGFQPVTFTPKPYYPSNGVLHGHQPQVQQQPRPGHFPVTYSPQYGNPSSGAGTQDRVLQSDASQGYQSYAQKPHASSNPVSYQPHHGNPPNASTPQVYPSQIQKQYVGSHPVSYPSQSGYPSDGASQVHQSHVQQPRPASHPATYTPQSYYPSNGSVPQGHQSYAQSTRPGSNPGTYPPQTGYPNYGSSAGYQAQAQDSLPVPPQPNQSQPPSRFVNTEGPPAKRSRRCKWQDNEVVVLLGALQAAKDQGLAVKGAASQHWDFIRSHFNDPLKNATDRSCETKWQKLRKTYRDIKWMREWSDFTWNEEKQIIVAGEESWQAAEQENPTVVQWRKVRFPFFDLIAAFLDETLEPGKNGSLVRRAFGPSDLQDVGGVIPPAASHGDDGIQQKGVDAKGAEVARAAIPTNKHGLLPEDYGHAYNLTRGKSVAGDRGEVTSFQDFHKRYSHERSEPLLSVQTDEDSREEPHQRSSRGHTESLQPSVDLEESIKDLYQQYPELDEEHPSMGSSANGEHLENVENLGGYDIYEKPPQSECSHESLANIDERDAYDSHGGIPHSIVTEHRDESHDRLPQSQDSDHKVRGIVESAYELEEDHDRPYYTSSKQRRHAAPESLHEPVQSEADELPQIYKFDGYNTHSISDEPSHYDYPIVTITPEPAHQSGTTTTLTSTAFDESTVDPILRALTPSFKPKSTSPIIGPSSPRIHMSPYGAATPPPAKKPEEPASLQDSPTKNPYPPLDSTTQTTKGTKRARESSEDEEQSPNGAKRQRESSEFIDSVEQLIEHQRESSEIEDQYRKGVKHHLEPSEVEEQPTKGFKRQRESLESTESIESDEQPTKRRRSSSGGIASDSGIPSSPRTTITTPSPNTKPRNEPIRQDAFAVAYEMNATATGMVFKDENLTDDGQHYVVLLMDEDPHLAEAYMTVCEEEKEQKGSRKIWLRELITRNGGDPQAYLAEGEVLAEEEEEEEL